MKDFKSVNSSQYDLMSQLLNQNWLCDLFTRSVKMTSNEHYRTQKHVHEVPNLNEVRHELDEGTVIGMTLNEQVTKASINLNGD